MIRCPVKSLVTLIILLSLTSFIIILIIIQIDMNGYEAIPTFSFRRPFLIDPNIFMNQIFSITDNRSRRNMIANNQSNILLKENLKDSNNLTFQIKYYVNKLKNNKISHYTYQDVGAHYTGPIVEGWPPTKSRNVSRYISKDPVMFGGLHTTPCIRNYNLGHMNGNLKLLIMQHSAPTNFEARQSSRNTWMKFLKFHHNVRAIFLIGHKSGIDLTLSYPEAKSQSAGEKLRNEHERYCDILHVNFEEHANNNTLKTLHALKYLIQGANGSILNLPEFVMKTDDDIYVNLPNIMRILSANSYSRSRFLGGNMPIIGGTGVLLDVVRPNKVDYEGTNRILPYIFSPYYMYDKREYPQFLSGSGYIFERSSLPCIYAAAITLPYYHIEDVFITGFVAEACEIPRVELTGHHPGRIYSTQVKPGTDTLMHYITPKEKYNIHKAVINHMFFNENAPI